MLCRIPNCTVCFKPIFVVVEFYCDYFFRFNIDIFISFIGGLTAMSVSSSKS